MAKADELIERMRNSPRDCSIDDLKTWQFAKASTGDSPEPAM
jgi:hypothetical protein